MSYCQLNPDGTFLREVSGNVQVWDANNYCGVDALVKDGKAEQFNVYPLVQTPKPDYDPVSQVVVRDGAESVDGKWHVKWKIADLAAEEVAANLANAKVAKRLQINVWRAEANQTYFTHQSKRIACDALSRSDIDAVAGSIALTGAFPAGFPGAWKAMDNSYVVLANVDAFKAMYASMTAQGSINFGKSQALKAELDAATTAAQVAALVWE